MKLPIPSGAPFVLALLTSGSVTLTAVPIDFPASGVYEENFDTPDPDDDFLLAPLGEEWIFIYEDASEDPPFQEVIAPEDAIFGGGGWLQRYVDEFFPTEVVSRATFTNPDAVGTVEEDTTDYDALMPIAPPQTLTDIGFEGGWLINEGLGAAFDVFEDGSEYNQLKSGTARVEFQNLPAHIGIDLDFFLAIGDSIDGGVMQDQRDGNFEIRVDGETVYSAFQGNFTPPTGVVELARGANFIGSYLEDWTATPPDDVATQRALTGWTTDSAYDFSSSRALSSIDHTADTLTVDFINRLSSAPTDEYNAIDKLAITLLTEAVVLENQWPGGDTFSENFDEPLNVNFWALEAWSNSAVFPAGQTELTGNADGVEGVVRPSAAGDSLEADFPLEPLVPAQSLNDIDPGFAGNWLVSNAATPRPGTTTLAFTELPTHTGLSLGFKFAAGNSIDGDDQFASEIIDEENFIDLAAYNFAIRIDGEYRLLTRLAAGGGFGIIDPFERPDGEFFDDLPVEAVLATNANLGGYYAEQWNDAPQSSDDRTSIGWTLDSSYDFTAVPQLQEIAHTADSVTIEFLHALDGATADEFMAIDSFELQLLGTGIDPPDPAAPLFITGIDRSGLPSSIGVTFSSTDGLSYDIERGTDLADFVVISPVAGVPATAGGSTTFTDAAVPAGAPRVFYRVRERAAAP